MREELNIGIIIQYMSIFWEYVLSSLEVTIALTLEVTDLLNELIFSCALN
jgi:hypothetical protein